MNHYTKLPDPMDITLYLQTEGRRIAAELGRRRPHNNKAPSASSTQQQCAAPDSQKTPRSLSETLRQMGIRPTPARHL
jgi:hypothetical protein